MNKNENKPRNKKKINAFIASSLVTLFVYIAPFAGAKVYSKTAFLPIKSDKELNYIENELDCDHSNLLAFDNNSVWKFIVPKKGITMKVDPSLYEKYKEAFIFTKTYLNSIFSVINPDIVILLESAKIDKNLEISFKAGKIYYVENNIDEFNLGQTTNTKSIFYTFENFVPNSIVEISKGDAEKYEKYQYAINAVILHETLHALGLNHILSINGGNVMNTSIFNFRTLTISPEELKTLITIYGDNDKVEFYKDLLNWYTIKYEESDKKFDEIIANRYEFDDLELYEQIMSLLIDIREFDKVNYEELTK